MACNTATRYASATRSNIAAADAGGQRAACIYSIIETCLCRARHRQVYAERRTMPSWLHQVDGCRWFACTSFGIV
jgi:transposase